MSISEIISPELTKQKPIFYIFPVMICYTPDESYWLPLKTGLEGNFLTGKLEKLHSQAYVIGLGLTSAQRGKLIASQCVNIFCLLVTHRGYWGRDSYRVHTAKTLLENIAR